ncbi:DDE transposase family protein [Pedobacter sp. SL55]|uniref:DDE transposase family protein n=1 Tax=Pedobacter sp. SL55 TaxID=2995161 RepID=UPI00227016CE|nr:DDE transposase family protein [Pedobacter sp. SL55]WAC40575.1 DDE transposase family protein [Pedobacter sp. SL55]
MAKEQVKERASKAEIERKKEHAKILYVKDGISTQKELAERVGVSEKTIGKWIVDGEWEKLKKNVVLTRQEQLLHLMDELAELNASIRLKPEGVRFADSKLGDVRRKLIKDIKDMETKASIPEIIHALTLLLDFVRKGNLEQAKDLAKIVDAFIKSLL